MNLTIDVYSRATPEALAIDRRTHHPDRNHQLEHLDELVASWRRAGYLVDWVAAGFVIACDDRVPLTMRHAALARDAEEHYSLDPRLVERIAASPDPARSLRTAWDGHRVVHTTPTRSLT